MTYEELTKVNSQLKTMDIKGKKYVPVNERIKGFKMLYPNGSLVTELVKYEDATIIMKAIAFDEGRVLAQDYAKEVEGSSNINRTSALENASTSAVGRCLGLLGIGIDTSVASFEEVSNAQLNQEANILATPIEKAGLIATIRTKCTEEGLSAEEIEEKVKQMTENILKLVGYERSKQPEGMTAKQYGKAMSILNGGI